MTGEDALFHGPWSLLIILQEGLIVVRFDEHGIDAARRVDNLARGVSEIGEDGEG